MLLPPGVAPRPWRQAPACPRFLPSRAAAAPGQGQPAGLSRAARCGAPSGPEGRPRSLRGGAGQPGQPRRRPRLAATRQTAAIWTVCPAHPARRPGPRSPGGSSPTSRAAGPTSASPSCATADGTATSLQGALLPGYREPAPILRLRYQGSAGRWAIGIYLASSGQYTETELPTSFGPKTGTPEEGVDDTFVLYAGPESRR